MRIRLCVTDRVEIFNEYKQNNIASGNGECCVLLHDEDTFSALHSSFPNTNSYKVILLKGYESTFIAQNDFVQQFLSMICTSTPKPCEGCDFYKLMPTLEDGVQVKRDFCTAGNSMDIAIASDCPDYEPLNMGQREEREEALAKRVVHPGVLLISMLTRGNWAEILNNPELSTNPPQETRIRTVGDIKRVLERNYIRNVANSQPGRSASVVQNEIFFQIVGVLQEKLYSHRRWHNIECNSLLISPEFHNSLTFLIMHSDLTYLPSQFEPLVTTSVEAVIKERLNLTVVVTHGSTPNFELVFNPELN